MLKKILILLIITTGSIANAAENLYTREISNIGCHYMNEICYVNLSGEQFGSTLGCYIKSTDQFRFDSSTSIGRRAYASFLAAFLAKKTINVTLEGCSSDGWPSLKWFFIN